MLEGFEAGTTPCHHKDHMICTSCAADTRDEESLFCRAARLAAFTVHHETPGDDNPCWHGGEDCKGPKIGINLKKLKENFSKDIYDDPINQMMWDEALSLVYMPKDAGSKKSRKLSKRR